MIEVRELTLFPEHAELFRFGLRTVETRPNSTSYRGLVAFIAGRRDPDSPKAKADPISRRALDAIPHGDGLTRGAVVCVGRLVACLPINPQVGHEHEEYTPPDDHLYTCDGGYGLFRQIVVGDPWEAANVRQIDLTDEQPFGDWSPGRYGWVFDDVRPVRPVPARGHQGLIPLAEPVRSLVAGQAFTTDPAPDRVTVLMRNLEESVAAAKAARDRHRAGAS